MIKRNRILGAAAAAVVALIIYYSFSDDNLDPNYKTLIQQQREAKESSLVADPDSPFQDRAFNGLNYYPIDPKWRVQASLERFGQMERIFIPTNDGQARQYQRFALARFRLEGSDHELVIFREYPAEDKEQFFLPFGDETSALETYGAGRYIDLRFQPGSSRVEIDFNLAYNPFCAYNPTFSCPLPPPENQLRIAIRAGEKNYD